MAWQHYKHHCTNNIAAPDNTVMSGYILASMYLPWRTLESLHVVQRTPFWSCPTPIFQVELSVYGSSPVWAASLHAISLAAQLPADLEWTVLEVEVGHRSLHNMISF